MANQWYTAEKWPMAAKALALEEQEERNCVGCTGISMCRNQVKGSRQVVIPHNPMFPQRGPVTAIRMCEFGRVAQFEARMKGGIERSGIGDRFMGRTFDSWVHVPELAAAFAAVYGYAAKLRNDMDGQRSSLLLMGPVGVGKTHLAAATLFTAIGKGMIAYYTPAPDFLTKYSASFQDRTTMDLIDSMATCEFLLLDDLGKEKASDTALPLIFQVINSRYESMLPTVITTNLTMADIKKNYGDAVQSRLLEMCQIVTMSGEDYRRKAI